MTTLRIEHAITDFAQWHEAFDRFSEARANAGVRRHRIHQPHDDTSYVLVDLDFDDVASAKQFLDFLQSSIWALPENAPALAGPPITHLLTLAEES